MEKRGDTISMKHVMKTWERKLAYTIRPIVLYACGAYTSTKADEKVLITFDKKILNRIFGPKNNTVNNENEWRTNEKLREIFSEPDIVSVVKTRRVSCAGRVWRAVYRIVNKVTMWKADWTRSRRRPRQWWIDRDREDLKLLGIRDEERLVLDRGGTWWGVVETTMDLNGLK